MEFANHILSTIIIALTHYETYVIGGLIAAGIGYLVNDAQQASEEFAIREARAERAFQAARQAVKTENESFRHWRMNSN